MATTTTKKRTTKAKPVETVKAVETEATEAVAEEVVVESPVKSGTVKGCVRLNIRKSPNGDVITVIEENTKVTVNAIENGWTAVTLPDGVEGFAMSEFIVLD